MKNYRLVEENHDHFVIHDTKDKSQFKVAKSHLDLPMTVKLAGIQKFAEGGDVKDPYASATTGTEPQIDPNKIEDISLSTPKIYDPTIGQGVNTQADPYQQTNNITTQSGPVNYQPQSSQPEQPAVQVAEQTPTSPAVTTPGKEAESLPGKSATPGAGMADADAAYLNSMSKSYIKEQEANNSIAAATAIESAQQAQIQQNYAASLQSAENTYKSHVNDLTADATKLKDQIASTEIDPNHFWNNSSTSSKVGMLAGMIISGFGAGAGQGNMALGIINKNIDEDINAQKANLGKKQNLLSHNLAETGNLNAAIDQTRLGLLAVTQGQIQAAALRQGGPLAQAAAQKSNAAIDQQQAALTNELAVKKMGYDLLKQPSNSSGSGINTNQLLGLKYTKQLSPEDSKTIDDETKRYGQLANDSRFIDEKIDEISELQHQRKTVNPLKAYEMGHLIEAKKEAVGSYLARELDGKTNELTFNAVMKNTPDFINSEELKNEVKDNLKSIAINKAGTFPKSNMYGVIDVNDPLTKSNSSKSRDLKSKFKPKAEK